MKTWKLAAMALTGALALTGCGAAGSSGVGTTDTRADRSATVPATLPTEPGSVTVGSADFPEAELLAYLYAGALRAHGVEVTLHTNIGERATYLAALADGSIGAVPEYSGALLNYLDRSSDEKSSGDVYQALKEQAASVGYVVGNYSPAEDVDTLTVTRATADKYHLTSIEDLTSVDDELTLGAPAPFQTVPYGTHGLETTYGVTFGRFVSLAPGGSITQTALRNGTVDVADIFSTDPSIAANDFVSLTDPQNLFAAENVVPVFRGDTVTKPMLDAADELSAALTTEVLRSLVAEVADGGDPSSVAARWLSGQ